MRLDADQKSALIELVRAAAREEIMPRFRHLADDAIRSKSAPDDLVTDADVASEQRITEGARSILSAPLVVGEEAVALDASLLEGIADAELCVIIDPVDGTWNFANGLTTFGVILAVTHRGETIFGLLYDPVMDDWIMASKGEGTWFCSPTSEPRRLSVSPPVKPEMVTGKIPLYLFPAAQRERLAVQMAGFNRIGSLRCSCHEYRLMAQGKIDFLLNGAMNPWDHAAGVLCVEEAGGVTSLFASSPFGRAPYSPQHHTGPFLVAHNADTLAMLHERFDWLSQRG